MGIATYAQDTAQDTAYTTQCLTRSHISRNTTYHKIPHITRSHIRPCLGNASQDTTHDKIPHIALPSHTHTYTLSLTCVHSFSFSHSHRDTLDSPRDGALVPGKGGPANHTHTVSTHNHTGTMSHAHQDITKISSHTCISTEIDRHSRILCDAHRQPERK